VKVFFDGEVFTYQSHGGISRVFFELIRELSSYRKVEMLFYHGWHIDNYPFKKKWFKKYYGLRQHSLHGYMFKKLFDRLGMELAYNANASSKLIYHPTVYRLPKRLKGPVVIHVHDLIHELFGGNRKTVESRKKAIDRADLIFCVSESTRKDLCELYQVNPQKTAVAYNGVSDTFLNYDFISKRQQQKERKDKRPYILYVGARSWYKNFDFLLEVFISKKLFTYLDLVLVGGGPLTIQQQEIIDKHSTQRPWLRKLICTDYELAELYSNATALVCTSLYEGFGIPLVEAMACGCPVIAPNISSIPEVVPDKRFLYIPGDAEDLNKRIEMLLNDSSLSSYFIEKGRSQALKFNWEATAKTIYEGYSQLI